MARKRWATFSVADHLNMRALVPDVLLFDRLAFPYPADDQERQLWVRNGWDPKLLQYVLVELEDLALPIDWGAQQREQFQSNMKRAEALEQLPVSWIEMGNRKKAIDDWQLSLQMTRQMIGHFVREQRGTDFIVMPCYQSPDAFLSDQNIKIKTPDRQSRRESLARLVGQEMRVPDHADPKRALRLAIEVARDPEYQRCRRALYNWQEDVVQRDQTSDDDVEELRDLIADVNGYVTRNAKETRRQWFFFVLKGLAGALEPVKAAVDAVIEGLEIVTDEKENASSGPIAAFLHVQKHVLKMA